MATYLCTRCGSTDVTGWTDYYVHRAMEIPVLCATCDPKQRCPWHNDVERRVQDEAGIAEVEGEQLL